MQTQITTEKQYTISYYKPGSRNSYGLTVTVSGDKKSKVIKEAREMLEMAQANAVEVFAKLGGNSESNI